MVNLSKTSSLVLACLLFYLSVSAKAGYFLPADDCRPGHLSGYPSLWYGEAPYLYNLTQPFKNQLESLKNLPVFNLKEFSGDIMALLALADKNLTVSANMYLSFSKIFCPRFEVRTILFPFHYFW
jgi:hypothetical protein